MIAKGRKRWEITSQGVGSVEKKRKMEGKGKDSIPRGYG